ncbi:MAG: PEGA domain-containing protein [Caldisericia bacterium]|nr:PEGA domain-containing protein [Caldisericia bacterium]
MIGKIIKNRYKIYDKVGSGGVATVYIARDLLTNEVVAIKILKEELTTSPNYVKRFLREAEIVYNMNHPNIAKVKDFGVEEGIYFIVMEYIEGKTLSQILEEKGVFSIEEAMKVIIQVLEALQYAYEKGVEAHRDIKPQNIMIDKNQNVKVMDFGIARVSFSHTMTQEGSFLGTPYYISPEQAQGKDVDIRSDIYSVGITLYQLITGKPPFDADTPWAVVNMHLTKDVPKIKLPEKYEKLNFILKKALDKNRENRYRTPREFIEDLKKLIDYKVEEKPIIEKAIIEEGKGELFVETEPSHADILINGEKRGISPILIENLPNGKYEITIFKEGYEKKVVNIDIIEGKRAVVKLKLKRSSIEKKPKKLSLLPIFALSIFIIVTLSIYFINRSKGPTNKNSNIVTLGSITVKSDPTGLDIYINGNPTGKKTPFTFSSLEPGNYKIEVFYQNESKSESINLNSGENREIYFNFLIFGKLIIESEPRGAKIFLDGIDTNITTPGVLENVKFGKHQIKLVLTGYEDYLINIDLNQKEKQIKAKLNKILSQNGTLEISTIPEGATVFINEEEVGETPLKLSLEKGIYNIKISLEGYKDYITEVTIEENKVTKLEVKMEEIKKEGVLIIKSTPSANVYINGKYRGTTPLKINLPEGEYTLSLILEGYEKYEKVVKVYSEKEEVIEVNLKKLPITKKSYVVINSTPSKAEVYIDKKFVGLSNGKFEVTPGKHEILLKLEGYLDYLIDIDIKEGETKELNIILTKNP